MSQLKVNSIVDAAGGSSAVLYGVASPPNSMGFRNRLINSDMRIDQRNAGASVAITTSDNYITDRFLSGASANSKLTGQQNAGSITPPAGFTNYLGMTVASSANVTVGASDAYFVGQQIEGFNTADLAWGTASAQAVTLSFWVRSSLTGTFGGSLRNSAGNRSYPFTYTINAANTWELETITIPGDTAGTWLTTNGIGIRLIFGLGVGSTLSGTAGAWAGANYVSAAGATKLIETNSATFYITGVQLEAGSVASPFERRDYGRELMMCQRYALKISGGSGGIVANGYQASTTAVTVVVPIPVSMRADTPTVTSLCGITDGFSYNTAFTITSVGSASRNAVQVNGTISANGAAGRAIGAVLNGASDFVLLTTEL